jgi:hypothetical protein
MTIDTLIHNTSLIDSDSRRSVSIVEVTIESLAESGDKIDDCENAEKDEGEFEHDQEISSSFILLIPSTNIIPLRNNSETDIFSIFAIFLIFWMYALFGTDTLILG